MPTHLAGYFPDRLVRTAMTSDMPAPKDVYTPAHRDSGGGLLDFLASTQMILFGVIAVLAVVLLVAVNWMHRREDRDLDGEVRRCRTPRDKQVD